MPKYDINAFLIKGYDREIGLPWKFRAPLLDKVLKIIQKA
jgi:hypothetical protein